MKRSLTAGIIGLGWWGRELVASTRSPQSRLRFVSAVTKQPDEVIDFAAEHNLSVSVDVDDILHSDVDVVVLATPHSLHVDQIIACAEAGKPVFCEKPLALNLPDARRAVEACERRPVTLGLGTDKRFFPAVRALTEIVHSGELGDVLHVEAQYSNANTLRGVLAAWRASPAEAPAGGMTGPGLHALDAVINLVGEITNVHAMDYRHAPAPRAVDTVAVLLRAAAGATALVSTVRGVPEKFRIQVAGTTGSAEIRGFSELTVARLDGDTTTTNFPTSLATGFLLEEFAAAVLGERPFPVSTTSMLQTVAAFEAIVTSIRIEAPVEVTRISAVP